jgi:Ca-activated chloride channel family protein
LVQPERSAFPLWVLSPVYVPANRSEHYKHEYEHCIFWHGGERNPSVYPPKNQESQEQENQQEQEQQQNQQDQQQGEEEQEGQEPEEQEDQKGEQSEPEKEPELSEEEKKALRDQAIREMLEKMNLSPEKARMILDAMKNNEVQYLQQNKRKGKKKKEDDKPDW